MKVSKVMKGKYLITIAGKSYEVVQNWHNTEWKLYEIIDGEAIWCETFSTKSDALDWLK